jgi:site-specific DNA-cytosine methylase
LRSLCKQIGNAVPPLLSIVLAKTIKSIFRK